MMYIVDFGEEARGIFLGGGNVFLHEPFSRVLLRYVTYTGEPVTITAYSNGRLFCFFYCCVVGIALHERTHH